MRLPSLGTPNDALAKTLKRQGLNRSIVILPGFILLVLFLTIVYALLGLRGPDAVLREARRALDRKEFDQSVRLLDAAAEALAGDRTGMLEQAIRMRILAYSGLGIRERVLADIDLLFEQLQVRDRDLMCTRIRMHNELAREDDNAAARESAWKLAEAWLAEHPKDPLVLAEAGVSKDLEAAALRESWIGTLNSLVPHERHESLRRMMDRSAHAIGDEAVAAAALGKLIAALAEFAPSARKDATGTFRAMQILIRQSREFYLRSLAGRELVPEAFQGLADQLRAGGEDDTLLMVCHSFLRRAEPRDGLLAAVEIADVHLRHHRYQAVDRLAEQALPLGCLRDRYLAGTLDHNAIRVLASRAIALRHLQKPERLRELRDDFVRLIDREDAKLVADLDLHPWQHFIFGLVRETDGARRAHLLNFVQTGMPKATEWNRGLVLEIAYQDLTEVCLERERPDLLRNWMRDLPRSVAAVHAFAKYQLSTGGGEFAVPVLSKAVRNLDDPDTSLEMLIEAERTRFTTDLDQVILQAKEFENDVPDEIGPYPALTIAVARRALETDAFSIARACADRAHRLFARARTPVYLLARAELALENPIAAIGLLTDHLVEDPTDRKAWDLLAGARLAAGPEGTRPGLEQLMYGQPNLKTARYLARRWLQRGSFDRVLSLVEQSVARFQPDLEMQVLATKALIANPETDRRRILIALRAIHETSTAAGTGTANRDTLWAMAQFILRNPAMVSEDVRSAMLDRFLEANRSFEELESLAIGLARDGESQLAFRCYRNLTEQPRYRKFRRGTHFLVAARLAVRVGAHVKALGLFRAALAFPGGGNAGLDLVLLNRLGGEAAEVPADLKVDSVRAAAITPDRDASLRFLRDQLVGDPDDFSAQCVLATLDPEAEVSPSIRATAARVGSELAFVTALLEDEGYATQALERLTALRATHPRDAVLAVLTAKAHTELRKFEAAKTDLAEVGQQVLNDTPLTAESVEFLIASGNPVIRSSRLMDHLSARLLKLGADAPPALMASLIRHNAEFLRVPKIRSAILPVVVRFWLRHPRISGAGLAEAKILIEAGYHTAAMRLLKLIEADVPEAERGEFLDAYFGNLEILSGRATTSARIEMIKEAGRALAKGPVRGAPLHLALEILDGELARYEGTPEGTAIRDQLRDIERGYLVRQLDAFLADEDPSIPYLIRSLRRLQKLDGTEAGLKQLDRVLDRDPSVIELWQLRAEWLTRIGRIDEAIPTLAWLPGYLDDSATVDTLIDLMGRAGVLIERGQDYLSHGSMAKVSRFSLGMVQLRMATYHLSAQAMVLAQPRPDGHDLYFRALALLGLQTEAADVQARVLLRRVAAEFPKSAYAPSAETVLRVL